MKAFLCGVVVAALLSPLIVLVADAHVEQPVPIKLYRERPADCRNAQHVAFPSGWSPMHSLDGVELWLCE